VGNFPFLWKLASVSVVRVHLTRHTSRLFALGVDCLRTLRNKLLTLDIYIFALLWEDNDVSTPPSESPFGHSNEHQ